jgi:hypothetical protein
MGHTKEPWIIDEGLNQFQIIRRWGNGVAAKNSSTFGSGHGAHIACIDFVDDDAVPTREQAKANADRIVDCVNACEGIDTENLEMIGRMFADKKLTSTPLHIIDKVEAENKRLREALEEIAEQKTWENLDRRSGQEWDYWKMRALSKTYIARAALREE